MAELAWGGLDLTIRPRTRLGQCLHDTVLSVTAAGVERSICEDCGHISVRFVSEISGPVFRSRFARPADDDVVTPQVSPFSPNGGLGLRRREPADPETLLPTG